YITSMPRSSCHSRFWCSDKHRLMLASKKLIRLSSRSTGSLTTYFTPLMAVTLASTVRLVVLATSTITRSSQGGLRLPQPCGTVLLVPIRRMLPTMALLNAVPVPVIVVVPLVVIVPCEWAAASPEIIRGLAFRRYMKSIDLAAWGVG